MASNHPNVGETSKPRFEFRTFGQAFATEHLRMARLSVPIPEKLWERNSSEIYIVSRTNSTHNTKIREAKLDVKALVRRVEGLEQWNPLLKADFPVRRDLLERGIFTLLQVAAPEWPDEECSLEDFLALVHKHPDLHAVRVQKRRLGYMVNDTICEKADVLINGARVVTLSSESTEVADIKAAMRAIGLDKYENINYLQAIQRVIGLIAEPLAKEVL